MHANMAHVKYKSKRDLEEALDELQGVAKDLAEMPGLVAFHFVRVADDEHIHMGVFDSAGNAQNAREQMGPRVMDVVTPHARGRPDLYHGPVLVNLPART